MKVFQTSTFKHQAKKLHVNQKVSLDKAIRVLTTFLRKCNIRENSILQKACRALDLQFS